MIMIRELVKELLDDKGLIVSYKELNDGFELNVKQNLKDPVEEKKEESKDENNEYYVNLRTTLLRATEANKYVKIYDSGYLVGMCYIDSEDLFIRSLDDDFLERRVKQMKEVEDADFNTKIYIIDLE